MMSRRRETERNNATEMRQNRGPADGVAGSVRGARDGEGQSVLSARSRTYSRSPGKRNEKTKRTESIFCAKNRILARSRRWIVFDLRRDRRTGLSGVDSRRQGGVLMLRITPAKYGGSSRQHEGGMGGHSGERSPDDCHSCGDSYWSHLPGGFRGTRCLRCRCGRYVGELVEI